MPKERSFKEKDPALRGGITFKINNFSHLLFHLYQARIISALAANLGSITGKSVSREELFTAKKEIFTEPVT
jgi:hypothetical protein